MTEVRTEKCFRQSKINGIIGITFVILMLAMGIIFILGMVSTSEKSSEIPLPALFIIFVSWLGFMSIGVWMVLAYYRERLILSETIITKYGVFGKQELQLNDITQLTWFSSFNGIVVESNMKKLKIKLDGFKKNEQTEIIKYLQDAVDLELQSKWHMFYECYRRVIDPQARVTKDELIASLTVLVLAGIFGFLWWIDWGIYFLLMSFLTVFSAVRIYQGH